MPATVTLPAAHLKLDEACYAQSWKVCQGVRAAEGHPTQVAQAAHEGAVVDWVGLPPA